MKNKRLILAAIMSMSLIMLMSLNNGGAAAKMYPGLRSSSSVDATAMLEQWQ